MKTTRFVPKQRLQAATRQISRPMAEDYDHEPNMKLSSAFFVVLVLHVVAVGGIFTFSRIKSEHPPAVDTSSQTMPAASPSDDTTAVKTMPDKAPAPAAQVKPPAPDVKKIAGDSGEFYTVVKGDNPVAIARKLHVSYDALLKLNKVDDPKKLQIGQKLRIPGKTKPARSDD